MTHIESLEDISPFVPHLNEEDANILVQYISLRGRTGSGVKYMQKSVLLRFFQFIQKPSILDIDESDIEEYFCVIDTSGVKYTTKKSQRAYLNAFFQYCERKFRRKNPSYYNPVPPLEECHFTPDISPSIEQITQKENDQTFTTDQLKIILKDTYFMDRKYFFITALLTFCGMRISECVTIRLENINLDGRFLMTGIDENARKSNKTGDHPLYFIIPKDLVPLLFDYIMELKIHNPKETWLFPGQIKHIKIQTYWNYMNRNFSRFHIKTHSFRRTLETSQLNLINRVPLHFVELLSGHVISSVVMKHYNKISIEDRRQLYDEYLPKEYHSLLEFLRSL